MIDGDTDIATWLGDEREWRLAACVTDGGVRAPPNRGFVDFVETANLTNVSR